MKKLVLDRTEILEILPYGETFCFVNKVTSIDLGKSISTEMTYYKDDLLIAAHFPSGPRIVPGVILIEQVCQSALLLGLLSKTIPKAERGLIGRIKTVFSKPAIPICTVQTTVRYDRIIGNAIAFSGDAYSKGALLLKAQCVSAVFDELPGDVI